MANVSAFLPGSCLKSGEVGIEIEVEGIGLPEGKGFWKRVADPSLRGECGEYVLNEPIKRDQVNLALTQLQESFSKRGTEVFNSYRAGIHVHVNVQEMSFTQVMTYVFLYYLVEEQLLRFCDKSRQGNHFCLRMKDAKSILNTLEDFCLKEDLSILNTDAIRYAAVNLKCIPTYGSLEFRALECTTNWRKLELWVKILCHLKDEALLIGSPTKLMEKWRTSGLVGFVEGLLSPFSTQLPPVDRRYVIEAMRDIQPIIFSRSWSEVNNNIFSKKKLF